MALSIIIVLLLSSIFGADLLDKQRTTGGMETRWKLDKGGGAVYQINNSIIVDDKNGMEIKSIDSNGMTWAYPYDYLQSLFPNINGIGLIDKNNGTSTLEFLGLNGSLKWSYAEKGIDDCYPSDGNFYVHINNNSLTNEVLCLNNDGSIRWRYTSNLTIGVWGVCHDGTTILDYNAGTLEFVNGSSPDDLVSISSNGTVLGSFHSIFPFIFGGQETNGTILAYYVSDRPPGNSTLSEAGFSEDLQKTWSIGNVSKDVQLSDYAQTVGSITYNFTHSQDDLGNDFTTLNAYNSSDGILMFRSLLHGNFTSRVIVNQGTVYLENSSGLVWAVDPYGRAYCVNNTAGSKLLGKFGDGLLLGDDRVIELIDSHGSREWKYDVGETINTDLVLANDTIIVITDDAITAIYKPQISTTMMEIVGLVGIDLFVVLLGSMWLLDIWFHKGKKDP
jgi:hypothetical protein